MRVLFTTTPLSGHFFPLVPLAWAFRALGHEVLVAASDPFLPTVLGAGLPAASSGPGADLRSLSDPGAGGGTTRARLAHGTVFARVAAANLPGTAAIIESWRPDLLVCERAEFAGPLAAHDHGVPFAELRWGVAELREYAAAAEVELAARLATRALPGLPHPVRVLDPWPAPLRLPHADAHHSIRHVPFDGPAHVPGWALGEPARRRVCLTLGTLLPRLGVPGLRETVTGTLRALAGLDVEVVVAIDDEMLAAWPELRPMVRHAGRLPLSGVLRACDAAIHHGGQGTCLTALAAGRPQLVLPSFDDQLENADAVAASGAGSLLPLADSAPRTVVKHILEVLENADYSRAAEDVAGQIAGQPSPVEVAGALERLAA